VRKLLAASRILVAYWRGETLGVDLEHDELAFQGKELVGHARDLLCMGAVDESFGSERFSSIEVRAGRIPMVLRNKVVNIAHSFVRLIRMRLAYSLRA